MNHGWDAVQEWLYEARGIAWDTCHKIYILMDDQQMTQMAEYGYDPLLSASDLSAEQMYAKVQEWYEESCGLRFVNAVRTHATDPNLGFTDLIPQGYDEDEDEY